LSSAEVRANLVYRQFTRVGCTKKCLNAKTLGKLGLALGPAIIEQIHQRVVAIAQEKQDRPGAQAAGGHHGGGDRHSSSDRQQPVG